MTNINHLDALTTRLHNEKAYLAAAKSSNEKALRTVWITQIEKEIAAESKFLNQAEMSDDELLAELMA